MNEFLPARNLKKKALRAFNFLSDFDVVEMAGAG